jgi:hypothetical protein
MSDMTHIPESIAKQPLDPNVDYTKLTEAGEEALKLVKKVFTEITLYDKRTNLIIREPCGEVLEEVICTTNEL